MRTKLDILGDLFKDQNYANVVAYVERDSELKFDEINNDDQAEFTAISAFSYFNIRRYDTSLGYALKLVKYIEKENDVQKAHELYENLVLIIIDSYYFLGKKFKAYFFLKSKMSNIKTEETELKKRLDKIAKDFSILSVRILTFSLILIGVVIVALHSFFDLFGGVAYMSVLVFLACFLAVIELRYGWFVDNLKKMF
jgi:hypothetical protein